MKKLSVLLVPFQFWLTTVHYVIEETISLIILKMNIQTIECKKIFQEL